MERRAPDPGPRAAWAFALVALVLGVGSIVFIAVEGNGRHIALGPDATPTPTLSATASPSPTDALAVTGEGPRRPAASTIPGATAAPATARTEGTSRPAGPVELAIEFPQDGDTVVSRRINVFGRGPGGAVILRDRPDGSTQKTVARPDGLWVMGVDLEAGPNELAFRVEGAGSKALVVRVTYQPR